MLKMAFKWETNSHASPQGLQKIWFCAHPADYPIYREALTQEILRLSHLKCAIFYDEAPEAEYDRASFLSDLKNKMQLFVMPITRKLLRTKNRAIDVEFPWAIENHIPVLPIMQEQGLETEFNEKCGTLQFLDSTTDDPTAIPYKEKFKKYLESVLIKNNLDKEIRKAFDTYIFMSYRKMDREHAQKLMRMIHSDASFRDVAIWYDEYLVPGEEFEKNIKKALQKSKLFVLAITPNVAKKTVDKDGNACENYIVSTEYPMACKLNKSILPTGTEFDKINFDELSVYENLPTCIDAQNKIALSEAFNAAFEKEEIKLLTKNSPQHHFLIGLAYLTGLDVEKNHERAFTLIESAAQADYLPAIEKLVTMYRTGEGVTRNPQHAIMWQQRVVDYWKAHKRDFEPDDMFSYICALWELGDYLYEIGDLSNAQIAYEKMNKICQGKSQWDFLERCYTLSYYKLGKTALELHDIKSADKYATMGHLHAEYLLHLEHRRRNESLRERSRPHALSDFAMMTMLKGDCYILDERECDRNEPIYYLRAMQFAKQSAEKTKSAHDKAMLSAILMKLGDMYIAHGIPQKSIYHDDDLPQSAEACYLESLKINRALVEETRTKSSKISLIKSLEKLIDFFEESAQHECAKEYCDEIQQLRLDIQDEIDNETNQESSFFENLHRTDLKEEVSRKSVEKYTPEYFMDQGKYYEHNREGIQDKAKAKICYLIGLEMIEGFHVDTFSKQYRLVQILNALGRISHQQKHYAEAKLYYIRELRLRENLLPRIDTYKSEYKEHLHGERGSEEDWIFIDSKEVEELFIIKTKEILGDICKMQGEDFLEEAEQYYFDAIKQMEIWVTSELDYFQKDLARLYQKYAKLIKMQIATDSLFWQFIELSMKHESLDLDGILSKLSEFSKYDINTVWSSPDEQQRFIGHYNDLTQNNENKEFYQQFFSMLERYGLESGLVNDFMKVNNVNNPTTEQFNDTVSLITSYVMKTAEKLEVLEEQDADSSAFLPTDDRLKEYWRYVKKTEAIYSDTAKKTDSDNSWHELADFCLSIGIENHSKAYLNHAYQIWEGLNKRKPKFYERYLSLAKSIIAMLD